jgi:hypothetical protein
MRQQRDRAHRRDRQRVAIGGRLRHRVDADRTAGAALVLDDELLPHLAAEFFGERTGDGIGSAAGRIDHDQPDRLVRIGRVRRGKRGQRHGAEHGEMGE